MDYVGVSSNDYSTEITRKIKLLFVIGTMTNGGAERVISVLSNSLIDSYEISILQIYRNQVDYKLDKRINIYFIDNRNSTKFTRVMNRCMQIKSFVNRINPDLVISFIAEENIYTLLSLRKRRYPIIISERNDPERSPESIIIRKLRDFVYRMSDAMVFQTNDAAAYFSKEYYRNIKKTIIPNPVKQELPYHSGNKECVRFVSACRLYKQKNIPMMINAVYLLKKRGLICTLDIFGEGPLRGELENLILKRELSAMVHIKHFTTNIHDEIANAVGFVLTSDYEGISNSMLEALCIGTPVIATDCPVGGARMYIVNGENGFLIKCGDSVELADKMQYIMENYHESEEMVKKAIALRDELSIVKIVEKWKVFIDSTIESHSISN